MQRKRKTLSPISLHLCLSHARDWFLWQNLSTLSSLGFPWKGFFEKKCWKIVGKTWSFPREAGHSIGIQTSVKPHTSAQLSSRKDRLQHAIFSDVQRMVFELCLSHSSHETKKRRHCHPFPCISVCPMEGTGSCDRTCQLFLFPWKVFRRKNMLEKYGHSTSPVHEQASLFVRSIQVRQAVGAHFLSMAGK